MIQMLCNECAAKVRLNFPNHELAKTGYERSRERCGHCHKQGYCTEFDMKKKEVVPNEVAID